MKVTPNYNISLPGNLVYRRRGDVPLGELMGMAYGPDDAKMVAAVLNGEEVWEHDHFPPYASTWYDVEDSTGDRIISLRNHPDADLVARLLNSARVKIAEDL
ncbi:hypothetical protein [Kineosporia sp. NBRC 101731]|uniref:hypothetical protein n=1 Tax=Kineosporia sp. NBRC 101731 TaxID=3032199 RepID=UPI00249F9D25|nr:hypothetical protein [Kineosporia sp. NBRC 101731]GLY32041.1 hypothetical protein Kisp02_54060 [Kineosporia sp. NBRC 101731]